MRSRGSGRSVGRRRKSRYSGETAAAGATERLESGEGSLKEVKELGGILQALVGTAAKMCQSEKNKDTAVNEIRVIMSEEVEELSG